MCCLRIFKFSNFQIFKFQINIESNFFKPSVGSRGTRDMKTEKI